MKLPQFFKLERNGRMLHWLGIVHTCNNKHTQFKYIEKKWIEFLESAHRPLIVVEALSWRTFKTKTESIQINGETGFMKFLSDTYKIPVCCFEPNRQKEMNYLAGLFGREKTEYYYLGRAVAQWYREDRDKKLHLRSIGEYLLWFLKAHKKTTHWRNFEFTIGHLKRIHKNLFGDKLNLKDEEWFLKIKDPTNKNNPLQSLVQACGAYRDKSVIRSVKSAWKKNDIFMVYGNGHREAHESGLSN